MRDSFTPEFASAIWRGLRIALAAPFKFVSAAISSRRSLVLIGFVAILALGFAATAIVGESDGIVLVASPQVYTRERLVNDRYDQDTWLRGQLDQLQGDNIVTGSLSDSASLSVAIDANKAASSSAASASGNSPTDAAKTGSSTQPQLPADLAFIIRASTRDTIRELILENSLDDRHDLRGSSIYGLKFDTTVIPVGRSDRFAYVEVSLNASEISQIGTYIDGRPQPGSGLTQYEQASYDSPRDERLMLLRRVYTSWVDDVRRRLDQYSEKAVGLDPCVCGAKRPTCNANSVRSAASAIAAQTLSDVLGVKGDIPEQAFSQSGSLGLRQWPVALPASWGSVINIKINDPVDVERVCLNPLRFETTELVDTIVYVDPSTIPQTYQNTHLFDIGDSNRELYFMLNNPINTTFSLEDFQNSRPKSPPNKIEQIARHLKQKRDYTWSSLELPWPPTLPAKSFVVPSGFFNFIARMSSQDSYTYALLPRSELAGYFVDSLSTIAASAAAAGSVEGTFESTRAIRGARATPRTVGFSRAINTTDGRISFGWVIMVGRDELGQPTQKSHLALVSIPAWVNEISVCVKTNWRSRGLRAYYENFFGTPDSPCQEMKVPVPRDYEALDAAVISEGGRLPPRVFSQFIDRQPISACGSASIVIPGERLWRNTIVTLGGQPADRIIVLPNMRGIVAQFNFVARTAGQSSSVDERKLRVWTTEGTAEASEAVRILPATNASDCVGASKTG